MRFHPIFPSVSIFIALLSSPVFGMNDLGVSEEIRPDCALPEKSATYRQVLSMTDQDVESQCTLEKGMEYERCKSVLNYMRDSAKASQEASQTSCQRLTSSPRPLPRPAHLGQSESFSDSAHKVNEARDGNIQQGKIHNRTLEDMRDYRDQMKRGTQSLISERQVLEGMDTATKVNTSVVTAESRTPASRAATIPEPSYDDYQVGRHITSPRQPPTVINASTNGSRNLAEYERSLPDRIEQQQRMLRMMDDFEEETKVKKAYNDNTALELGKQAATLLLQAKQLGAASDSLEMPLAAGPKASDPEKVPSAAAAAAAKAAKAAEARPGFVAGEKMDASKAGAALTLSAKPGESSEEAAVLDSFQSRLMEDGKGKLSSPERSRLRDLLRRRSQSRAGGSVGSGVEPGELVAEMLEEAAKEESRVPASEVAKANDRRGIVRLDVNGAIAEIESQLEELDRSMGILNMDSESLFDRVRAVIRRSEQGGSVGQDS